MQPRNDNLLIKLWHVSDTIPLQNVEVLEHNN
jgi:hypothetical protein